MPLSGRVPAGSRSWRMFCKIQAAVALAIAAFVMSGVAPARQSSAPTVAPAGALQPGTAPAPTPVRRIGVRIVARYPHDATAFTQGLVWHGGHLFESTGHLGRSEVRKVRLSDGKVLQRRRLLPDQFGEGLALAGKELISLTWQNGVAHRWDAATLRPRGDFRYSGEGWGLASDGTRLFLSDGTPEIRLMDPTTFAEHSRVTATANGRPVRDLNELEVIDGQLFANVWHKNYLVRIAPSSGVIDAVIDLSPLVQEVAAADPEAVLNGIAWDPDKRRLFVTGKWWPTLFEVQLLEN